MSAIAVMILVFSFKWSIEDGCLINSLITCVSTAALCVAVYKENR